ncbi:polyprenyl synthetase family protein [Kitasatospora sp. NPDC101176]|uniref:polyprenyl synthetase family protein n=1 Tax=Kitasatospora sp. NPDC101176 TaxID=3364099 RepID=UPI00381554E8
MVMAFAEGPEPPVPGPCAPSREPGPAPVNARPGGAPLLPRPHSPEPRPPSEPERERGVERHLDRLYPPAPGGLDVWLPGGHAGDLSAETEQALDRRLHRALAAPVRHVVEAGGKRWRPALLTRIIELLGGDGERFGVLAAALELAHTGSLVVDDVQDGSTTRRARPAAHEVYGLPAALTAGTCAYFAFDHAIGLCAPDDPELRGRTCEVVLAALRAAHAGQALDIQGHGRELEQAVATGDNRPLLELVLATHRLKTGALVGACCRIAALTAGAGPALERALLQWGTALGTAYQITDDVADLCGVTDRNGTPTKRVAEDLRNGKVTLPLAHAVTLLPRPTAEALWAAVRGGDATEADVRAARTALLDCGAVAASEDHADRLHTDAWRTLEPLLPRTVDATRLRTAGRRAVFDGLGSEGRPPDGP